MRFFPRSSAGDALGIGTIAVALAVSRAMVSMLYGVAPTDAGAIGTAAIGLLITVLVAAAIPARRAARIEPMRAD